MGPIQVVVEDGNNIVLEVTPTPDTTVILDRGIPGPVGPMGDGDVDGPASSTDNAVVRFNGTTGKVIQNSNVTIDDSGNLTYSAGTANGVAYLNGSKVLTTGPALTFDGTNLGVGTTSPGLKVDIAGGGNALRLRADGSGIARMQFTDSGVTEDYAYIGTPAANALAFWVGGSSEQMRLTSTGLGIGTSSPAYKLQLNSATAVDIETGVTNSAGTSRFGTRGSGNSFVGSFTAGKSLELWAAGAQAATLDSSGNLGLGVTPSAWDTFKALQVGNSSLHSLTTGNNSGVTSNAYFQGGWKYVASSSATYYQQFNGQHIFFNAPSGTAGDAISFTQAMTLDASGNLLVGTTSAVSASQAGVRSGPSGFIEVSRGAGTDTWSNMTFLNGNGVVGVINTSGSTTSYVTSSDYRLKNTIAPMTGALAKVALLKPCTYKWNADGSDGEGFIAHELAEVVPQCVTGEKDAVDADGKPQYQGIDTSFLVATLTAAIQELKAEFDAYKASHP